MNVIKKNVKFFRSAPRACCPSSRHWCCLPSACCLRCVKVKKPTWYSQIYPEAAAQGLHGIKGISLEYLHVDIFAGYQSNNQLLSQLESVLTSQQ